MLKLRLKKCGRKRMPSYRLVIMEHSFRRDGKFIDEVGFYTPITKKYLFNTTKIKKWLNFGAKPTKTVLSLLKKSKII